MSEKSTSQTNKNQNFFSTYTRIAMSEWKPLVKIFRLHSKYIKELSTSSKNIIDTAIEENLLSASPPSSKLDDDSSNKYHYELNENEDEEESKDEDEDYDIEEKSSFELELERNFAETFGSEFASEFSSEIAEENTFSAPLESFQKNIPEPENSILPPLPTAKQIQITLEGPYHQFIKKMLTAYAKVARLRYEKYLKKENIYKGVRTSIPDNLVIPEKTIEKVSFATLKEVQKNLDELTNKFHEQWQEFYTQIANDIIEKFKQNNLKLTEYEIKELHDEEPMPELLPKFIELNMRAPHHDGPANFIQYLSLKLHLILNTSLSRQHLPHSDEDIHQILKKFKSEFNQMAKQEKKLIKAQSTEIDKVLQF